MIIVNVIMTLAAGAGLAYLAWIYPPAAWTTVQSLGVALTVVGFALWTLARFQLGSSLAVTAQAKQLVVRGLYSKIRNPIYVSSSIAIGGFILLLGRPVWLLILAAVIPLQVWRARVESRVLAAKFGDQYRAYRAATWF